MYIIYNKSKYKKQAFTLRNKKNAYKIKISIYNQSKNLTYKIQKEKRETTKKIVSLSFCRDDRTRTCDHLVPNQVHYQLCYIPLCRSVPLFLRCKGNTFFLLLQIFFKNYFIIPCSTKIFFKI